MKNILLVTSLYPCDDVKLLNNTAVCHYFAKEWKKLGYNVRVIFNYNMYPWYYYPALKLFKRQMANIFGISIQDHYLNKRHTYTLDGILIDRLPILKNKPHGGFSEEEISKQANLIRSILEQENFVPDIILGHFAHPSLEIVALLKKMYNVMGAVSLHGPNIKYSPEDEKLYAQLDYIGFRSYPTKKKFESLYPSKEFFMCPSGVPVEYITKAREFKEPISRFIYVGTLMKRKYPEVLIPAIKNVFKNDSFSLTYVGDGANLNRIVKVAKKNDSIKNINFAGRIPRHEVTQELDKAEVFIMISEIETFGLVYLEAMARGCIVVASRNEGMDGIIEDGVNGFLCEAGNEVELSSIILKIRNMSSEELNRMSQKGIETAHNYTDSKVAKDYIDTFKI